MTVTSTDKQSIRQLYDRFEEQIYNQGNVEALDELMVEDFVHHAPIDTPDGRIAEEWAQPDMMGLMQQLGVLDTP